MVNTIPSEAAKLYTRCVFAIEAAKPYRQSLLALQRRVLQDRPPPGLSIITDPPYADIAIEYNEVSVLWKQLADALKELDPGFHTLASDYCYPDYFGCLGDKRVRGLPFNEKVAIALRVTESLIVGLAAMLTKLDKLKSEPQTSAMEGSEIQATHVQLKRLLVKLENEAQTPAGDSGANGDSQKVAEIEWSELTDTEQNLIEALGDESLIAEKLVTKAEYTFNSNQKGILSSLRKRKILGNKRGKGYFLTTQGKALLKSGQSHALSQD